MSINKHRSSWQVKWREGGRQRSRSFKLKKDAQRFETANIRRLQLGPVLAAELDRSTLTLDEYVKGPWRAHAATLAAPTRAKYKWALSKHLRELRGEPLVAIDVARLADHQRLLIDRGVSASTVREVLTRLSGILQTAVE